jgi:HEAT repeat protein
VAAARALEALRYRGAGPRFREILQSKEIRSADLTEQIAMFEAYGAVEDPQAVSFLGKYLNGKGFLGRREPSEIRACAALALGKVGTPEAKEALRKAVTDDDPVVRNAVGRALRGGQGGAR